MLTVHSPLVADFTRVPERDDVVAGLAFFNRRVEQRCTAVYRLQALTVRNSYLYDREGALLPWALSAVPLGDSFCFLPHPLSDEEFEILQEAACVLPTYLP